MKGLAGARVVLVDDDVTEAMPVIKAFSRAGVPVAYFDGTESELPRLTGRLRGVRLAILDMDLGVGGPAENKASTLVGVLGRIIAEDNGPYGILIWTKHPELKDLVTQYIYERSEVPNPVFVTMLKKANFIKSPPKQFAIAKLSKELFKEPADNSPLECLQVWEGLTFRAATNVTDSIATLSGSDGANLAEWKKAWQEEALRLLFVISKAQAEEQHSAENCIPALFLALNPLHSDRMELLVGEMPDDLEAYVDGIMAAKGGSKVDRKARVNSMLHLAADRQRKFTAGNLYVFARRNRPAFVPQLRDLLSAAVQGNDAQRNENVTQLTPVVQLCGVEISPLCDHAQGKLGVSRILLGLLVPHDHEKKIKSAGSLKRIGPLYFAKTRQLKAGTYNLYLDSRYVAAAKLQQVKALRATVRVRPQLLADIQSWAAYQGSRQGVMLLN
jgi:hypothetical protein